MQIFVKIQQYILLFLLIFFGGVLLLGAFAPAGFAARVVLSGSMEPAISTGSVVFTLVRSNYSVGDVVTFNSGSNDVPTTHRIVSIEEGLLGPQYITRGDANTIDDFESVQQNRVYGKVLFHIPYLGYVLDFAKTPLGFLLLVGFPALFVIVEEIKKIIAEVRKTKNNIARESVITDNKEEST